ncbi:MAG: hypothetical protein Q8P93_02760 [bacterium]|nr:hypothetical protein [bacterium]
MASQHEIECNVCDFKGEVSSYFPFYIEDGVRRNAITPISEEATKKISGYTNYEYCINCNESVRACRQMIKKK